MQCKGGGGNPIRAQAVSASSSALFHHLPTSPQPSGEWWGRRSAFTHNRHHDRVSPGAVIRGIFCNNVGESRTIPMGAHYGSVQVRRNERDSVLAASEKVAREYGVKCLVSPVINGWVGIYPENNGQD